MTWLFQNGRINSLVMFAGLLATGILSGALIKFQQRSVVNGVRFNHPFMQTLMMFIGESLCYTCFIVYKCCWRKHYLQDRKEEEQQGMSQNVNKCLFIIPALLDFIGSSITLLAMSMMPFSVYYMMRGGGVIITAILSVICLKTDLERQNYVGLLLNFVGFIIVGIAAVLYSDSDQDTTYLIFGIMLIMVSLFTGAFQLVFEERTFKKYSINPLEEMGWEGIWGTLFTSLALIAFVHIPCPYTIQNCPEGKLESVSLFISTLTTMEGDDQPQLVYLVVFSIFVLMMINGFSICVTKYSSAINKSMVSAVSPFVVWIITIGLQWDEFNFGQFTGYSIITCGTLIYNEVIVLPFCGMNQNLRRNRNQGSQFDCQQNNKKRQREIKISTQQLNEQNIQINKPSDSMKPEMSMNIQTDQIHKSKNNKHITKMKNSSFHIL